MDEEIQEQNSATARGGNLEAAAPAGRPRKRGSAPQFRPSRPRKRGSAPRFRPSRPGKRGRSRVLATAKQNGFIIALLCAVGLAFLFPSAGAKGGWLQPDLVNNIGVALILFVQGLAMAVERMKAGAGNWRLHLIVQGFTFFVFPVVGWVFHESTRAFWPGEPGALRDGFSIFAYCLPRSQLRWFSPRSLAAILQEQFLTLGFLTF